LIGKRFCLTSYSFDFEMSVIADTDSQMGSGRQAVNGGKEDDEDNEYFFMQSGTHDHMAIIIV